MRVLTCNHCNNTIAADDTLCASCGMPLSPEKRASPQRKFIYWFIFVALFSMVMMLIAPFFGSSRY